MKRYEDLNAKRLAGSALDLCSVAAASASTGDAEDSLAAATPVKKRKIMELESEGEPVDVAELLSPPRSRQLSPAAAGQLARSCRKSPCSPAGCPDESGQEHIVPSSPPAKSPLQQRIDLPPVVVRQPSEESGLLAAATP